MKKDHLKSEFIHIRAEGYTLDYICNELNISKPTAIKWNKLLNSEIIQRQKILAADFLADRIAMMEDAITIRMNTYRQIYESKESKDVKANANSRVTRWLEKFFAKKIKSVHLDMKNDNILGVTFVFDDSE